MILLPNRQCRTIKATDYGYICIDEYEDFSIEAHGKTEAEAIEKACCYDLVKEAMQVNEA